MNPLFAAALGLQQFFEARTWRFCFIGGLAVQRWGEPRLTLDVDCTLLDIEGIVLRRADALDTATIWRELTPLLELKEDTDAEPRLLALLSGEKPSKP